MTNIPRLPDISFRNKRVLVRISLDVPFDQSGNISDPSRIEDCLETLRYLQKENARIILLGHLGRPKGTKQQNLSLLPCAKALSSLQNQPVEFLENVTGSETKKKIERMKAKDIFLLENLRFYPGEEHPETDPDFARILASYGEAYVNEAFSVSHRKHASVFVLPSYFPEASAAGLSFVREIDKLQSLLSSPPKPFHLILGGAKVSSKIGLLKSLLPEIQALYIGGAMAFSFLKSSGISIGDCICEQESIQAARKITEECRKRNIALFLPSDLMITNGSTQKIIPSSEGIPEGYRGMDIGPKTIATWTDSLQRAGSVFWNGPLGVCEIPDFALGTYAIARSLSLLSSLRIIGGGDSSSAVRHLGLAEKFSYISSGGGASLEFLEKKTLPGLQALLRSRSPG